MATYYVSSSAGADTNNGTSSSTPFEHHPWDSNATNTANSTTLSGDDIVYMKKGDTWYDFYILVEDSGTSGHPIITTTKSDFGTGDNPVLSGSYDPSDLSFSADGGSYVATGLATEPNIVVYNGTVLTENDGAGNTVGANEWDWDADGGNNSLWVNVGEDPDTGTLLAGKQNYLILSTTGDYTTFQNLTIQCGNLTSGGVIYTSGRTGIGIDHCLLQYSAVSMVRFLNSPSSFIDNSTVQKVKGTMISIEGSDNWRLYNNTIYGKTFSSTASSTCIKIENSDSGDGYKNTIQDGWNGSYYGGGGNGAGIQVSGSSEANKFYRNKISGCYIGIVQVITSGNDGNLYKFNEVIDSIVNCIDIQASGTNPPLIYNNTIIHNPNSNNNPAYTGHGLSFQVAALLGTAANNIIVVEVASENCNGIAITDPGVCDFRLDYNHYYVTASGNYGNINGTNYNSLANWKTAIQGDAEVSNLAGTSNLAEANGNDGDPLFVSATDFHLTSPSPCINAGTDPFSDGDGDQYDLSGNLVWSDTTDSPVGYWEGGVEIGAYAFPPSGETRRRGLMRMGPRMR